MRLRNECSHGRYEEHWFDGGTPKAHFCPGGEFLAPLVDCDDLANALTASEGLFYQEEGWAELNDHGILIFDAAVEYLKLFQGVDALSTGDRRLEQSIRDRQDVGL